MRTLLLTSAVAAILGLAAATTTTLAGDDAKHSGHGKHRRLVSCPHCGDACYPTVTKGKETKHSWDVESKLICIPKVRFPWEKDCGKKGGKDACPAPKCGRTKCVNVLMKYEYECSTCKYSWDVDSYKNDKGPKEKASDAGPGVAEPPPVEADLRRADRRIIPVSF